MRVLSRPAGSSCWSCVGSRTRAGRVVLVAASNVWHRLGAAKCVFVACTFIALVASNLWHRTCGIEFVVWNLRAHGVCGKISRLCTCTVRHLTLRSDVPLPDTGSMTRQVASFLRCKPKLEREKRRKTIWITFVLKRSLLCTWSLWCLGPRTWAMRGRSWA